MIARIPIPITGPPHYTNASEAATMDFLQTLLQLLVGEGLAYSASLENLVGTEYIMTERVLYVG